MVVIYVFISDGLEIERIAQLWQDGIFPVRGEVCRSSFVQLCGVWVIHPHGVRERCRGVHGLQVSL